MKIACLEALHLGIKKAASQRLFHVFVALINADAL
jgi:hypothetical protein